MQTDLSHLPENKRAELAEIVRLIRKEAEVEMIILFGSYARGDWKEEKDLDPGRWSGHVSDYDLAIVVEEPEKAEDGLFWQQVADKLNSVGFSAHVRPLVYDINEINMAMAEYRYFFFDIHEDGRLLYDTGRFQLAEPKELVAEARKRLAEEYFGIWYESTTEFYVHYKFSLERNNLRSAAFNLNQATETAYKTILLVYTLYCPHEHQLAILGRMAAKYGPVFEEIFPHDYEQQRDYFEQLNRAYIGSRYQTRFKVTREELDYLAPRVQKLLDLTERLCRDELARLDTEVA
jgi:uncharacterized protein